MKKVTFSAVIYERFKNKDGKYPVKLRVTYNQKPTYFSTGLLADAKDLSLSSHKKNIPIKNNTLKWAVNEYVNKYEKAAENFYPDLFPDYTAKDIMEYLKKIISRDKGFRLNFVDYSKSFIEKKKTSSQKAAKNYIRAINLLCEFMGQQEFDISLLTSSRLREFEEYLRTNYSDTARTVSMATS
ncbi:MAG: phage integrase SAM-like domain-containing protein, partial [Bacteroidales bacterium]|nr:phage integrase SAM-like domain-containing protein [Bacteroidales bacterium]